MNTIVIISNNKIKNSENTKVTTEKLLEMMFLDTVLLNINSIYKKAIIFLCIRNNFKK